MLRALGHWQVRQAEQALRLYFVNFLNRQEWHRQPASAVVDEHGRTSPVAALQHLRARVRTQHYSCRTEASYADWVRRFFDYLAKQQGVEHPRVASASVLPAPGEGHRLRTRREGREGPIDPPAGAGTR